MSSQLKIKDYRRLSGERTYARAKIYVSGFSNGLPERDLSSLPMVFNLRGGCIYFNQYLDAENLHCLFPQDRQGVIAHMVLLGENGPVIQLYNLKIRFVRLKPVGDALGVVFSFVDVSPEQLDRLQKAYKAFPPLLMSDESRLPLALKVAA